VTQSTAAYSTAVVKKPVEDSSQSSAEPISSSLDKCCQQVELYVQKINCCKLRDSPSLAPSLSSAIQRRERLMHAESIFMGRVGTNPHEEWRVRCVQTMKKGNADFNKLKDPMLWDGKDHFTSVCATVRVHRQS
jgi:hypothetical protein